MSASTKIPVLILYSFGACRVFSTWALLSEIASLSFKGQNTRTQSGLHVCRYCCTVHVSRPIFGLDRCYTITALLFIPTKQFVFRGLRGQNPCKCFPTVVFAFGASAKKPLRSSRFVLTANFWARVCCLTALIREAFRKHRSLVCSKVDPRRHSVY